MGTRRDTATWIAVHDGMPDHPKIEELSDKAFRTLVELWCYCKRQRTDGYLTEAAWNKRTTPKVRRELIGAGLVDEVFTPADDVKRSLSRRDGVVMHDFLDWQRSASEAAELSTKKSAAGSYGNHQRWHLDQGKWSPDCKHCVDEGPGKGTSKASQVRSQMGSQTDRKPVAEKRREEEKSGPVGGDSSGPHARAIAAPRKTKPETPGQLPIMGALPDPAPDEHDVAAELRERALGLRDHIAHERPPDRCADHRDLPPDQARGSCPRCGDSRRAAADWRRRVETAEAARKAAYRAAVNVCPDCDSETGRLPDGRPCPCSIDLRYRLPTAI